MRWRWDQGRLQYFRYENIVKLAAVLESLDGVALGNGPDLLREPICNACRLNTKVRYPWTDNILELHHVLPLAASLNANGTTTLLDDLVALCPSCHKSIHVFYRIKLKEWGIEDFGSKKMALDVYEMAKREIVV